MNQVDADLRLLTGPYTLSEPGVVTMLSVYLDGLGPGVGGQVMKALLYAAAAGVPTALKVASAEVTVADGQAAGWVDFPVVDPVTIPPGDYWPGWIGGGVHQAAQVRRAATAGKDERWLADTYSDGPADPAGAMNQIATREYSVYATYTPLSGPTLAAKLAPVASYR